jgi:hypothetical protein
MRKFKWSLTILTTLFILWGFVKSVSAIYSATSGNFERTFSLSYNDNVAHIGAKGESWMYSETLPDQEIRVPEVRTLQATHVSSTKATLEGRVKKFEYIDGPKPARTGDKEFRGGVLINDGRIVLVPRTGKFVSEYDPITNTVSQTAEHGQEGGFGMGSVLDDGHTVILTPRGSRNVGIYDARTQTYRDGAKHGRPTDNAFLGSVKISTNLIVFGPLHSQVVGLYDPQTDIYKDGPQHYEADTYNFSVITLSSKTGKVIFTPFYSEYVGIYDPVKNTYTRGAAHNAKVLSAYSGSVELENGHIIMAPRNASHVGIYDPVSDTFIKGPEHGEREGAFMAATLMPDGEVIMAAFRSDHIGIYDPATGEYRSGPSVAHVPGVEIGRFSGAILTQAKDKIVMTNRGADVIGLVQINRFFEQGHHAEVFFHYRKAGETKWQQTKKIKVFEPGVFKTDVAKLHPKTEYEYRSIIRHKGYQMEGKIQSFKTA